MKDQYAGDINDYRKYGLLRTITESSDLSLAVCWMLTAPDGRRDGRARNPSRPLKDKETGPL